MPTVVELLRRRAGAQPADHAFHFIDDASAAARSITYGELDLAARGIGATLAGRGAVGRPVLLLYPPGLDYVAGFLGCLYAGAIAVPAYPPELARWNRSVSRLRALVADSGATIALSTSNLADAAPGLAGAAPELAALEWVTTDVLPGGAAQRWQPPDVDGSAVALLQYTSGSTGTPRGVVLSHANLWHNAHLVHTGFGTSSETVGVSWLPPYHDMGLIGGILQPLYAGFPVVLMSPLTFLRRPLVWLETIARFGATMSGGPNFAFDLCVRKTTPAQRASLDLSGWQVAFCGAEPIRAQTLDRFAAAFAPAGFRRQAFYCCYGLAEATLIVSGGQPPHLTGSGQVGSGRPLGDQRLVIADPATGAGRPAGAEGEIWLSGPSVAAGYWGQPGPTARTFAARLAGDPHRHYLRTGDLGFVDATGQLVVTGRRKDLIIVRGRNVHPQDLEQVVEQQVAGVRPGCTAAFPVVRDGEEQAGIACELAAPAPTGEQASATVAAIRQAVAEAAAVPVAAVVLLRRGRVPKTSSGKIQRYACRQAFESGDWDSGRPDVLFRWPGSTSVAGGPVAGGPVAGSRAPSIPDLVATALGLPPGAVPADAPLTRLGLDSLRAVELQGVLATQLGCEVSLTELLTGITTAELAARPVSAPVSAPTEPSADEAAAAEWPASDGQRALWLIQRWAPDSTAYQVSRAARIRSPLDIGALERALRVLVDRHPALRTCLPAHNGQPVQRVQAWSGPVLTCHNVSDLDEQALRRLIQSDADRPFDLASGPLLRASCYSRGKADHVLLLSLHHTITDFWSLAVMVDELLAEYRNPSPESIMRLGTPPAVDHEPKLMIDREGGGGGGEYWREALAGAPLVLDLPASFPRPRLQSFRGDSHQFRLSAGTLRRLDALAAEVGATRFAALAAGYAAVLARYTGDDDVIVGAPAVGRGGADHHRLGYFANPVPLRIAVPAAGSYRELVRHTRQVVIGALEHAVPFPRLVEAIAPTRDPGRPPLLQTMLVLQRSPAGRPDLGAFAVADEQSTVRLAGLAVQPYRLAERGSPFDLSLALAEVDGGLTGELTYCTDLFDAPAMAQLAGHLCTLLDRAAANPDAPLSTCELMGERERAAVLAFATGPIEPFPDQTTVADLFAARVRQQPAATAVVAGGHTLSYAELDRRADRLAERLVTAYRVGRGDLVGVYLPRGPEALVAFWAALKSGGVYLPLAPDLPPARLGWLVGDARPAVVLTQRGLADRLPAEQPRLDLEELAAQLAEPGADPGADPGAGTWRPGSAAGPDDPAYAVYTSGSTGRPKAVLLDHRGACNLAQAEINGLEVTPASRVLQFCSPAYDVHVSEILVAHLAGAALHIPEPAATVPGPALVALLARERITHTWQSPSVLAALPDADLPELTNVLCGGEACSPEVVARWSAPGRRFHNGYGPAEATVCATWDTCQPDRRPPPIGRPLPNVRVYVLDRELAPVPVGVPGEICIGGIGVGSGYLGRPGLTAQRFLPDPLDPRPGARLYRTGDRARWLPDGRLDFLGRFDDQVKIRGVRIEPGEVASRLRELLGIREVAVVPRAGPAGGLELVAYLVAPGAVRRPVAELRGLLRAELAEPWLPAAFVYVDALPLSRSGKLDRQALPAPAPPDRGLAAPLAPRTELEQLVADVWAAALGRSPIGVHDHFFDQLGGSSLLVAGVTGELGRRLARDVPVTWLFEHPTVEALAARLSSGSAGSAAPAPATPARAAAGATPAGSAAPAAGSPEEAAARRRSALVGRTRSADREQSGGRG